MLSPRGTELGCDVTRASSSPTSRASTKPGAVHLRGGTLNNRNMVTAEGVLPSPFCSPSQPALHATHITTGRPRLAPGQAPSPPLCLRYAGVVELTLP